MSHRGTEGRLSHLLELPPDLPAPEDDGACSHLAGLAVPGLDLAVLYVYPATGHPYPVFPPDRNAGGLFAWLRNRS